MSNSIDRPYHVSSGRTLQPVSRLRSLSATPAFWLAMFAASALGTNLGDFWVRALSLGWGSSLGSLLAISVLAITADRRSGTRHEAGYWVAIVFLRAAATNVADFLTEDRMFSGAAALALLGGATALAGLFTAGNQATGGTPVVNGKYWITMFIAGVFGTVAGDMVSQTIGLFAAAACLTAVLAVMIAARSRVAIAPIAAYWIVVLAERSAGTPVGDSLASPRAAGLGLPMAMACTGGAMLAALLLRRLWRFRDMA